MQQGRLAARKRSSQAAREPGTASLPGSVASRQAARHAGSNATRQPSRQAGTQTGSQAARQPGSQTMFRIDMNLSKFKGFAN